MVCQAFKIYKLLVVKSAAAVTLSLHNLPHWRRQWGCLFHTGQCAALNCDRVVGDAGCNCFLTVSCCRVQSTILNAEEGLRPLIALIQVLQPQCQCVFNSMLNNWYLVKDRHGECTCSRPDSPHLPMWYRQRKVRSGIKRSSLSYCLQQYHKLFDWRSNSSALAQLVCTTLQQ